MSHRLDFFFDIADAEFSETKKKQTRVENKYFVYCNDVENLCKSVENERGVGNTHWKIGIDGGGGFLKICVSLLSDNNTRSLEMKKARLSYSDNFDVQFLDSSVKKLFIIGIVEATQENFENVSILWLLLKLNKIECTVATDLKMANILIGIMSHSSKYPCKWCTTSSDELHKCGEMRTIRKCIEKFND